MIRTQIYITQKQHNLLKKKALEDNTTLSEYLRKIIDKEFIGQHEKNRLKVEGNWLKDLALKAEKIKGNGPSDLASNVDRYLYGNTK